MVKPKEYLREMILKEHSKSQRDKVVEWVGDRVERFGYLMELFLGDEYRVVQRAAWAVREIGAQKGDWIGAYVGKMVCAIENPIHDAVVRNGLLVLVDVDVPRKYYGRLAEVGFNYLGEVGTPTAIKRASLLIIAKICEDEPELKEELVLVLEDQLPHCTVGFVNIAKKYIRKWG